MPKSPSKKRHGTTGSGGCTCNEVLGAAKGGAGGDPSIGGSRRGLLPTGQADVVSLHTPLALMLPARHTVYSQQMTCFALIYLMPTPSNCQHLRKFAQHTAPACLQEENVYKYNHPELYLYAQENWNLCSGVEARSLNLGQRRDRSLNTAAPAAGPALRDPTAGVASCKKSHNVLH